MTHGSLFSGIGGFDLAAEWMGWENMFHCEINPFGRKVLNYYWPKSKSYEDIKTTDFTEWNGKIDVVSGGFPCQPYSLAGKRKGKEDDRHLWPEMLRAIREIQPSGVVGENVLGLLNWDGGMVFHEVQADLEAEGFIVFPYVLPACGVNAPHKRDRIWFVAYNNGGRCNKNKSNTWNRKLDNTWSGKNVTNSESDRINRAQKLENDKRQGGERRGCNINNISAIPNKNRLDDATDTGNKGFQRGEINRGVGEGGENRNEQLAGLFPSAWKDFPTQPPLCSRDDGLSNGLAGITFSKHRQESIKAYGNAIVPQVAYQIFKAIEQYELSLNQLK